MTAWICDRCNKPESADYCIEGHPCIKLTFTFSGRLVELRELEDKWEVCTKCFHILQRKWKRVIKTKPKPEPVKEGEVILKRIF